MSHKHETYFFTIPSTASESISPEDLSVWSQGKFLAEYVAFR